MLQLTSMAESMNGKFECTKKHIDDVIGNCTWQTKTTIIN